MSLCPVGTEVQTLIFARPHWTLGEARAWARLHGFQTKKYDKTGTSFRMRQRSPREFRAGSFRTMQLRPGVKAVIGCPKG